MYTHPFSFRFFSHTITEYWVEFSVPYSRSLLASHFIYLSVNMPIPKSPSPSRDPHLSPLITIKKQICFLFSEHCFYRQGTFGSGVLNEEVIPFKNSYQYLTHLASFLQTKKQKLCVNFPMLP